MEVLVTVIIIIILSAIALPQYQKAISKSRYVGLMPLARSIKDAEEDYYYREEDYTSELAYLSIQVPGGNPSGSSATINGTTISLTNGDANYVKASKSGLDNTLVLYFTNSGKYPGEIHCEAIKEGGIVKESARDLCLNLGGRELSSSATSADYVAYVLSGEGNEGGSGGDSGGGSGSGGEGGGEGGGGEEEEEPSGPEFDLAAILADIDNLPATGTRSGWWCRNIDGTLQDDQGWGTCAKATYPGVMCASDMLYGCAGSTFRQQSGHPSRCDAGSYRFSEPDYACAGSHFSVNARCYAMSPYGCAGSDFTGSGTGYYASNAEPNAVGNYGCYGCTFVNGAFCQGGSIEHGCSGAIIQSGSTCYGMGCDEATYEGTGCCSGDYCGTAPQCA